MNKEWDWMNSWPANVSKRWKVTHPSDWTVSTNRATRSYSKFRAYFEGMGTEISYRTNNPDFSLSLNRLWSLWTPNHPSSTLGETIQCYRLTYVFGRGILGLCMHLQS